jgi:hypothetical protein
MELQYGKSSVHFTAAGSGETVVLLHAGASSGGQWRKVAGHLRQSNTS